MTNYSLSHTVCVIGGALFAAMSGACSASTPVPDVPAAVSSSFEWPARHRAAVSLTYDDTLASQRTFGAAHLAAHRLTATFFLKGVSEDLQAHRQQWQELLGAGHELASHTMHHPCDRKLDWVPKGYATQDYDLPRMRTELEESIVLLESLGAKAPFTFAYPCGEVTVGEAENSYVGLVAELFLAGRGFGAKPGPLASMKMAVIPTQDGAQSLDKLMALIDDVEATGSWLVLTFHGVGGDYLSVELQAHDALLAALAERRDKIWTAPFGEVAAYVLSQRGSH